MRPSRTQRLGMRAFIAAAFSCMVTFPAWAQTETPWVDPPARLEAPPEPTPRSLPTIPVEKPAASPVPVETPAPVPVETPVQSAEPPRAPVEPPAAPAEQRAAPVPPPVPPTIAEPPARQSESPGSANDQAGARLGRRLPSPPEITLGLLAEQLTFDYLAFWSAPNAVTFAQMPSFYGREVVFHGRRMNVRALMNDKRRFARRWPERSYQPRRESIRIACDAQEEICNVRAIVDFVAESPRRGRRSQGATTLALDISFAEGRPIIVTENSQVIGRGAGEADDE